MMRQKIFIYICIYFLVLEENDPQDTNFMRINADFLAHYASESILRRFSGWVSHTDTYPIVKMTSEFSEHFRFSSKRNKSNLCSTRKSKTFFVQKIIPTPN